MGWVYECQQDRVQEYVIAENSAERVIQDDSSPIGKMKLLRFSESVIKQASEGRYSGAQIELLLKQKATVNKIIDDQTRIASNAEDHELDESLHPNITLRRKKALLSKKADKTRSQSRTFVRCSLRCCHVRYDSTIAWRL